MFDAMFILLVCVLLVAFAFDITNGMGDSANTVGPLVASRAVDPKLALLLVAISVGCGALLSGGAVAATIGSGIIPFELVTLDLVLAAIAGAIAWNVLTLFLGLPCSSSMALVGGLVGAGVVAAMRADQPIGSIGWSTVADKVFIPSLLAPIIGALIAIGCWWLLVRSVGRLERRRATTALRRTQIGAAMLQGFAQGTNDAQKTMGVVALAMLAYAGGGRVSADAEFSVPTWVVLACTASIAGGTLAGGWRVIATLSRGIGRLDVAQSVSATFAGGVVLMLSSRYGLPVSTTYASVGSILGAGSVRGVKRVKWDAAGEIGIAWVITVPCAAVMAAGASLVAGSMPVVVTAVALGMLGFMLVRNHRDGATQPVMRVATPVLAPGIVLGRSAVERRSAVANVR
jgi:PiT family inorganic phosphate transporter